MCDTLVVCSADAIVGGRVGCNLLRTPHLLPSPHRTWNCSQRKWKSAVWISVVKMHSLVPAACCGLFQPQLGFTGTGKMCAECQPFQGFQNTVWKLGGFTLERRSSKQVAACIYLNFIPALLLYLPNFFHCTAAVLSLHKPSDVKGTCVMV